MHTNTHKHIQKLIQTYARREICYKKDKPMQISSILEVN